MGCGGLAGASHGSVTLRVPVVAAKLLGAQRRLRGLVNGRPAQDAVGRLDGEGAPAASPVFVEREWYGPGRAPEAAPRRSSQGHRGTDGALDSSFSFGLGLLLHVDGPLALARRGEARRVIQAGGRAHGVRASTAFVQPSIAKAWVADRRFAAAVGGWLPEGLLAGERQSATVDDRGQT